MQRILPAALMVLTFALPAAAAPSSTSGNDTTGSQSVAGQNNGPAIAAQLRQNLADAGFTNIQVMAQSFLVRAKDKQGNPVMMVINPDSVTAVTAIPTSGANGSSSSGTTKSSGLNSSTAKQP